MATYISSEDYLTGDDLEEYLLSLDEDSEVLDDRGDEGDADEISECVCGRPALQRLANCSLIHVTCGGDSDSTSSSRDSVNVNTTQRATVLPCVCCNMLMGKLTVQTQNK